MQTILKVII